MNEYGLDPAFNEFATVIYITPSGTIAYGPVTQGTQSSSTAATPADLTSYGQIIGIVHSHPLAKYDWFDIFPSSHDWNAFDTMVMKGVHAEYRQYILAPDGYLYEYGAFDRDFESPGNATNPQQTACGG